MISRRPLLLRAIIPDLRSEMATGILKVSGENVIDQDGNTVVLRGADIGG